MLCAINWRKSLKTNVRNFLNFFLLITLWVVRLGPVVKNAHADKHRYPDARADFPSRFSTFSPGRNCTRPHQYHGPLHFSRDNLLPSQLVSNLHCSCKICTVDSWQERVLMRILAMLYSTTERKNWLNGLANAGRRTGDSGRYTTFQKYHTVYSLFCIVGWNLSKKLRTRLRGYTAFSFCQRPL